MTALKILFWFCLFLVFYTYLGYGMLLWLLLRLKRIFRGKAKPLALPADDDLPHVTLMICAYNERSRRLLDRQRQNELEFRIFQVPVRRYLAARLIGY